MMTTECFSIRRSIWSRLSSRARAASAGSCPDPRPRVVVAPIKSLSSLGDRASENSLVSRNRVVIARRSRSAYFGSALVRDGNVAREECLERAQDVCPAAASADEKNVHFAPVCFTSARRIGTITHLPAARRRSLMTT